ncbi:hypothetical protein CEUSTIGMA_g3237.t1 [Chlamydomonas eustigma]|uniref:Uncharacterized protein n=1 Tax=Chlamydomonas eustigma TaxID=1157962 RepID=A0A250WY75_9CHLO|nr:hypothetical protein CEUSTIGMA_g3237.t1 [Chlamydomonas eustigma]|eukprot:GAX75794.1 hypothetical protein CEUSTIGMA_g3237.t1 [Chlamydomonas eustigma]
MVDLLGKVFPPITLTYPMGTANINLSHLDDFNVYEDNPDSDPRPYECQQRPAPTACLREPLSDISSQFQPFYKKIVEAEEALCCSISKTDDLCKSPTTKQQVAHVNHSPIAGAQSFTRQADSLNFMGSCSLKRLPPASPTSARCSKKEASSYGSNQEGLPPRMPKLPRSPFAPNAQLCSEEFAVDLAPLRSPLHRVSGSVSRSVFASSQNVSTASLDVKVAEETSGACMYSLNATTTFSSQNCSSGATTLPLSTLEHDKDGGVSILLHKTASLALDCRRHA